MASSTCTQSPYACHLCKKLMHETPHKVLALIWMSTMIRSNISWNKILSHGIVESHSIASISKQDSTLQALIKMAHHNFLRRELLKLVDGGQSQRTFVYIKDAIEAVLLMMENPARTNGHIFNVGNPNNKVTVRQLAEMMTQVYFKVSGEPSLESATIDMSSKEFYGEGYDDSDKRIPDMTLINKQLGWNPKTSLWNLLESTLTYQHI